MGSQYQVIRDTVQMFSHKTDLRHVLLESVSPAAAASPSTYQIGTD